MQEPKPGSFRAEDEDLELALLMERAAQALERLGLTTDDILDELAVVHAEELDDAYGADYMQEIERHIAAYQRPSAESQPRSRG